MFRDIPTRDASTAAAQWLSKSSWLSRYAGVAVCCTLLIGQLIDLQTTCDAADQHAPRNGLSV